MLVSLSRILGAYCPSTDMGANIRQEPSETVIHFGVGQGCPPSPELFNYVTSWNISNAVTD